MIDTDRHWEKWGKEDPYFGVLAHDRFRAGSIVQHRDQFFASGRQFVTAIIARYERNFGPLPRGRALDHGCGVGRLALPLAAEFSNVVAIDVSASMLREAAANAERHRISNVTLDVADDHLSTAEGLFDFVNSHIVLQHIPVRRGLRIFFSLIEKVRPGGGFHIDFSYRLDRNLWGLLYWASANVPGVKLWQNLCAGRRWNAPAMQMNHYPLSHILARLASMGIRDLILLTEHHPRFVTCGLIGRKPALG